MSAGRSTLFPQSKPAVADFDHSVRRADTRLRTEEGRGRGSSPGCDEGGTWLDPPGSSPQGGMPNFAGTPMAASRELQPCPRLAGRYMVSSAAVVHIDAIAVEYDHGRFPAQPTPSRRRWGPQLNETLRHRAGAQ